MEMTRIELLDFWNALQLLGDDQPGAKFNFAVIKNIAKMEGMVKKIAIAQQKAQRKPESFVEFDKARKALCKEYADRDDDGEPKMVGEAKELQFVITERKAEFDEKIKELQEEHAPVFKEIETNVEAFGNLMREKIDLVVHQVNEDDVPYELTRKQIKQIAPMIFGLAEILEDSPGGEDVEGDES